MLLTLVMARAVLVTVVLMVTGVGFDSFEMPTVQKFLPLVVLSQ